MDDNGVVGLDVCQLIEDYIEEKKVQKKTESSKKEEKKGEEKKEEEKKGEDKKGEKMEVEQNNEQKMEVEPEFEIQSVKKTRTTPLNHDGVLFG